MDLSIERMSAVTFTLPDERSIQFRTTGAGDEWVLGLDRLTGYGTDDAAAGLIRAVVMGAIAGGLKDEVETAYLEGMAAEAKAEREQQQAPQYFVPVIAKLPEQRTGGDAS